MEKINKQSAQMRQVKKIEAAWKWSVSVEKEKWRRKKRLWNQKLEILYRGETGRKRAQASEEGLRPAPVARALSVGKPWERGSKDKERKRKERSIVI